MKDGAVDVRSSSLWSVHEFIRDQVRDWDDETMSSARFRAFSGQRSDWESRYLFWRDLIIRVARHLQIFIISPTQIKTVWFNRGGLTPLCLDDILFLMYNEGDIVRSKDLVDPTSGRVSQLYRKVIRLMSRSTASELILEDHLILLPVLKDKADEAVKTLAGSHWTSSCVITLQKLNDICGGSIEGSSVLSYLSGCGRAHYLTNNKKEFIEGVKVSLSPAAVCVVTSLDYDVLHLIWTTEKLQQQLDFIDQRCEMSRKMALTSLDSGNKKVALRHARELKLATESRENCVSLLTRVDEILNVIGNAESTKRVSEAIQIGARAMKEHRIEVEDIQLCLEELNDSIDSQKQIEKTLESSSSNLDVEDYNIEEEFKKLELEVGSSSFQLPASEAVADSAEPTLDASDAPESLTDSLLNLKIADIPAKETGSAAPGTNNASKNPRLEAA